MKRRPAYKTDRLMLPDEVSKIVYQAHVGLSLLPVGLFRNHHAVEFAKLINVIMADRTDRTMRIARELSDTMQTIAGRTEKLPEGDYLWECSEDELSRLRTCVLAIDKELRTWTKTRWLIAVNTVNAINDKAKAAGGKSGDVVIVDHVK